MQYLLTGLLIGTVFGMPIGAIGAMSIQRTLRYGPLAGLITGLASSVADVIYACIGAFGFTMISEVMLEYQVPIHITGAILMIIIAIRMIYKKQILMSEEVETKEYIKLFLSSFAIAITNPVAILSFLFAFSVFDIHGTLGMYNGCFLVLGVFFGTFLWWLLLTWAVNALRKRMQASWFHKLNIGFGIVLIVFSLGVIGKTM